MKQLVYLIPKSLVLSFEELSSYNINNTCFVQSYYTETHILEGGAILSNLAKHKHIHNFKYTSDLTEHPFTLKHMLKGFPEPKEVENQERVLSDLQTECFY